MHIYVVLDLLLCIYTRKLPPSAGSPSRSGGVAPAAPPLGAIGAPVGAPAAPIWEIAAFGGGERRMKKKFGAPGAPRSGRQLMPPSAPQKKIYV